ncbi:MAG: hypothetical protein K6U02_08085 [Firmicutes bacterium]|nr:hypothetical protein [Bacillota bacterium]
MRSSVPLGRRCGAGLLALAVAASGCGYRVAGRGSALPRHWKTLAVLALENHTTHYRLEQRLREALVRELLARTRYRVVASAEGADAVLSGEVRSIETSAVLFDAATGRATTMVVTVVTRVRLVDAATQQEIYRNDNFVLREQYEITTDVSSFFEEQDPALERLAQDFASRLVAALLEKF